MRKKSKLKLEEYQEAYKKRYEEGWGVRKISRYLGRSESTLSRLFHRDVHPFPGVWRRMTSYEKSLWAWCKSKERRSKSRKRLRLKSERLRKLVIFTLCRWQWSPEQISYFLSNHGLLISAKAIYNFIKRERRNLIENLRQRGKARRQRVARARSMFHTAAAGKKSIHERPPIIGPGHWEIDTIHSRKGTSGGVLTLRELNSKKRFFFLIPDLTAGAVMAVLFPFFQALPAQIRRSLTADNGSEFNNLYKLEKILSGFGVYYCEPYKAWQRGAVENANGELRWYFPKKTDFSKVSPQELKRVERIINGRPMKIHNAQSATAIFNQFAQAA